MIKSRRHTKLVHEGNYVAEVDVELIDAETGWSRISPWTMLTS